MVTLRPLQKENFTQVLKWAQLKDFSEFFRRFPPLCDWVTWERAYPLIGNFYEVAEDDKLVGLAVIGNYDFHARSNEVGVLVDSPNRSLVAGETLKQLCEYCFNYLNNNKVTARILTNRRRLAERMATIGFKQEGLLRSSCNGHDEILLGCLRSEYDETGTGN